MKAGLVILSNGPFGGAQRRFLSLFFHLSQLYKNQIYCFVTNSLFSQIQIVFPNENLEYIIPVGRRISNIKTQQFTEVKDIRTKDTVSIKETALKLFKQMLIYKCYYFLKNHYYQKQLYNEIDKYTKVFGINVFLGIHAGILPLYFYLKKKNRPGIVFSNMDSWFSNITSCPKNDWYKKRILFNNALENSDVVDFLSPYILNGVREFGVNLADEKISLTPCSFTDYTKCHIGTKEKLKIAFSGRLEKNKNPLLFLEAALVLAREFPKVEFHILGEGRLTGLIKTKIIESGLANILFHGFHPNPPEILAETSVFVSIQTTNNYPSQSVLEAMACGNAIIASDVGDTRMFVNEERGSLIELNLAMLIECLKMYINSPSLAIERGLNGSKYVRETHTIDKSADYYMRLLRKAELLTSR